MILKTSHLHDKGSFKCYVTLEGVGVWEYVQALRGGGVGVTSALRNVFFLANTAWFTVVLASDFQNNLACISNNIVPVHNVNNKNRFTH